MKELKDIEGYSNFGEALKVSLLAELSLPDLSSLWANFCEIFLSIDKIIQILPNNLHLLSTKSQ